ncbi:hypothetical protein BDK51DRAFT_34685 [Blyttiomyces helicus]|uniref:DUF6570 domain-containing protein n=1 Tax=Blyttiomyces helicus TaxID=388810 RepID=A0A4P9WH11_9FUNG|nr:hypothetical protein BDK51DRAFT_34685 [Blyttiomyces helicus]|eukprot:RKO92099.1 hypothetical protein BDK51DRAFT_34685 [Blyttiomyces helicus]
MANTATFYPQPLFDFSYLLTDSPKQIQTKLQACLDCTNPHAVGNPQPTWPLPGFFLGITPMPKESDTQTDLAKLSWTQEQLFAKCLVSASVYTLQGASLAYTPSFRASKGHISTMVTSPSEMSLILQRPYEEMFEDGMTEILVTSGDHCKETESPDAGA